MSAFVSSPNDIEPVRDRLWLAVAAFLAGYKGQSRVHAESDLRSYLFWCQARQLNPLAAERVHIELFMRWMQKVRCYKPSTVSRRLSVMAGFYRTCVIDGVLARSPAEHVRRPRVPTESPTLGLTHLQFEAMLTAARGSANLNDFALVAMLGLLGLRVFEATGADVTELSEIHGHRVLHVHGKGDKIVDVPVAARRRPGHRPSRGWPGRRPDPAQHHRQTGWTATAPPVASARWPRPPVWRPSGCIPTCSVTPT